MRKKFGFFLVLILLAVSGMLSDNVFAQQDVTGVDVDVSEGLEIAPDYILPPRSQPSPILGQDQSYSVVFRGNGEAVVSSKIVFTNREDEAVEEVSLRVPRVEPTETYAFQVIRERPCIRYKTEYDTVLKSEIQIQPRVCEEYNEPNYYNYGSSKYQKANYEYEGDTLTIKLPQEIPPDASGSFLLYYRAFGYAKKNLFGAYDYVFETLKADDQVNKVSVGISTDSDLYLKGARGEVDYRFDTSSVGAEMSGMALGAAPQKSVAIDNFANSIGRGKINKSASSLAPLESYQVKGSYADSVAKLYGKTIFIVVVVLIILLILLILGIRFVIKKMNKATKTKAEGTSVKEADSGGLKMQSQYKPALTSLGISFIVSLLITGYTVFIYIFGTLIMSSRIIDYDFQPIILLFLVVMSFIVYSLLLFGPAAYIGAKKSIGWGIATVVLTFFWLVIMLFIALFVLMIVSQVDRYPTPISL